MHTTSNWTSDIWIYVVWSDESSFMLFPASGGFIFEGRQRKPCNLEDLIPVVKHGGGYVMIWVAISWCCASPIITPNGGITASDYVDIIGDQVHSVVQLLFPNNVAVFQDGSSSTHSQKCSILGWGACSECSLASTVTRLKYYRTTVVGFREFGW